MYTVYMNVVCCPVFCEKLIKPAKRGSNKLAASPMMQS